MAQVVHRIVVARRRPVLARRPLDMHDHQAGAGLRGQLEHLLSAAAYVVDRDSAGCQSRASDLRREGVGRDRHGRCERPGPRSPGQAVRPPHRAGTGGPLRAATAPTSSMSKPASARAAPSSTARAGVPLRAPSNIESSVTLTIPHSGGSLELQHPIPELPPRSHDRTVNPNTVAAWPSAASTPTSTEPCWAAMARCSAIPRGSSRCSRRAMLEACHRAGVEVVIKSGRREGSVMEDAKLIGSRSYIYEVGCAGRDRRREDRRSSATPRATRARPSPRRWSTAASRTSSSSTSPGRLEWHSPWHRQRELSLLFSGKVDVDEANRLLAERGHTGLRLIDNGAIFAPMEGIDGPGARLPPAPGGGEQGERRRLSHAGARLRAG